MHRGGPEGEGGRGKAGGRGAGEKAAPVAM